MPFICAVTTLALWKICKNIRHHTFNIVCFIYIGIECKRKESMINVRYMICLLSPFKFKYTNAHRAISFFLQCFFFERATLQIYDSYVKIWRRVEKIGECSSINLFSRTCLMPSVYTLTIDKCIWLRKKSLQCAYCAIVGIKHSLINVLAIKYFYDSKSIEI